MKIVECACVIELPELKVYLLYLSFYHLLLISYTDLLIKRYVAAMFLKGKEKLGETPLFVLVSSA